MTWNELKKYATIIRAKFNCFQDKNFSTLFCVPRMEIRRVCVCVCVQAYVCACTYVCMCKCVCVL